MIWARAWRSLAAGPRGHGAELMLGTHLPSRVRPEAALESSAHGRS